MKTPRITKWAGLIACAFCASLQIHAANITLGGPLPTQREATLGSAQVGFTGSGNATVNEVEAALGGDWTGRGSIEPNNGGPGFYSNGMLQIEIENGTWGSKGPLSGNWFITDPSFWSTFGDAAISMHVGNGGGEPDHFIWLLTQGATSGTWNFDGNITGGGNGGGNGNGGGLSNFKFYSRGTANVPDGGATAVLLGLGVLGLAAIRRKS